MVADIVILGLLKLGPKHGYEIKKTAEQFFARKLRMNTNLLYPALHRLEEANAVEREVRAQRGKPTKHVYRVTPEGERLLVRLIEDFGEADAAKEEEFLVRLAAFDFLTQRQRQRILDQRRLSLKRKLVSIGEKSAAFERDFASPWIRHITSFAERHVVEELRWIDGLESVSVTGEAKQGRSRPLSEARA